MQVAQGVPVRGRGSAEGGTGRGRGHGRRQGREVALNGKRGIGRDVAGDDDAEAPRALPQ